MTDPTPSPAPTFRHEDRRDPRDDLAAWQELNVTAFLTAGIATSAPGLVGEPYRDADGTAYLPMLRQPVIVLTGDAALLARARAKAAARDDVALAIYTRDLFATMHDDANRAAVAPSPPRRSTSSASRCAARGTSSIASRRARCSTPDPGQACTAAAPRTARARRQSSQRTARPAP